MEVIASGFERLVDVRGQDKGMGDVAMRFANLLLEDDVALCEEDKKDVECVAQALDPDCPLSQRRQAASMISERIIMTITAAYCAQ